MTSLRDVKWKLNWELNKKNMFCCFILAEMRESSAQPNQ